MRRQLQGTIDAQGSVAGDRDLGAGLMEMDLRRFGLPSWAAAMEEDDGAVELSLGLSVGGSSWKAGGYGADVLRREPEVGSGEAEADSRGPGVRVPSSSSTAPPRLPAFQQGDPAEGMDSQRRREMHVMRRQDVRNKRHEKQQKKGSACRWRDGAALTAASAAQGFRGCSPPPEGTCSADDRVALEAQEKQWRSRDREAREEEARHTERRAGEDHQLGSDVVPKPGLSPNANANPTVGANPNPDISPNFSNPSLPPFGAHPFPLLAMQYPYPHVQYVPMANGFGFPCMMPCWPSPAMSSVAGGPNTAPNVFQPVACRNFQPFSPPDVEPSNGASPLSTKVEDLSVGNGTGIQRTPSRTGSLGSNSSSPISHHHSSSHHGGSSGSDGRSHSSRAPAETPHPQLSSPAGDLVRDQSEHSISSPQVALEADAVVAPSEKRASSNSTGSGGKGESNPVQCAPAKLGVMVPAVSEPAPAAGESTPPPLPSPLPRMPCVSTTGNGPNGKTITGFLYRYTRAEVSIVCVCHGCSFSPAEFVKHAGGTDTDNPLRHIIVVPS